MVERITSTFLNRSPSRTANLGALAALVALAISVGFGTSQQKTPADKPKSATDTSQATPPDGTKTDSGSSKERLAYEAFWYGSNAHTRQAAAVQVVGAARPWLMLSLAVSGHELSVWGGEPAGDSDQAPILKKHWLKYVPNSMAFAELPAGNYDQLPLAQRQELMIFSQALVYAGRTPAAALLESSKANEDVSWTTLNKEREKYQGQVVFLKGWLKRMVRKVSPPIAAESFVDHYYEGWVYNGFNDKNGVFVTFTELPKGFEPDEKLNVYIEFAGYYFKTFRYLSERGTHDGLFIVARTFQVLSQSKLDDGDKAPRLKDEWLAHVKDDRSFGKMKAEVDIDPQQKFEFMAYTEALVNAARTPASAFAKSARENDWLTFAHLFQEPKRYRGKVIPVQGRLQRLRKMEATFEAEKLGVEWCYEGWVFTETAYSPPVCVVFAHLPPGARIGENVDYKVRFDGYFFKRYLYQPAEGKAKQTLFFLAPTFELLDNPGNTVGFTMTGGVVIGMVALGIVTILLIAGLNLWFRRSDAVVRARVAAARHNLMSFEPPATDAAPENPAH
jgi:hypothetical protein